MIVGLVNEQCYVDHLRSDIGPLMLRHGPPDPCAPPPPTASLSCRKLKAAETMAL